MKCRVQHGPVGREHGLTRKVVLFWHVILSEQREPQVVHVEETERWSHDQLLSVPELEDWKHAAHFLCTRGVVPSATRKT